MNFNVTPKSSYRAFILVLTLIISMFVYPGVLTAQRVYATSQTNAVNGLCVLCGVTNPTNPVTNTNLDDFSRFNITVGLLGVSVQQTLIFPTVNPNQGCDSLVIGISNGGALIQANLFNGLTVETFNGGTSNNDAVATTDPLLRLLNGNTRAEIVLRPSASFDRVRLTLSSSLAGLLGSLQVYYAYHNKVQLISPVITNPSTFSACVGVPVNLISNISTPGSTIKWYTTSTGGTEITNPDANGDTLQVVPTAPATYYAQTFLGGCTNTTRSAVTVNTNPVPALPTLLNAVRTICAGQQATFNVQNPVAGVTYNWYDAASGGTLVATGITYSTPNLNSNTSYYVEAALPTGCVSASRAQVSVVVNPAPAAPVASPSNVVINSGQSATFAITSPEPGVTYTWYDSPAKVTTLTTGNTYTTPILFGTTSYYIEGSNGSCVSTITQVTATINAANNVPCSFANQNLGPVTSGVCALCTVNSPAAAVDNDTTTASTISLGVGALGSIGQLIGFSNTYTAGDSIVVVLQVPNTLLSATLLNNIVLRPYIGNVPTADQPTNLSSALANIQLLGIIGGTGKYRVSIPTNNNFNGVLVSINGGVALLSNLNVFYVAATIPSPTPASNNINICTGNTATLSVTPAPGAFVNWYDVPSGGTALASGTNTYTTAALTNTKVYYVATGRFGCENGYRVPITVNVNQIPAAPAVSLNNVAICSGDSTTFSIATPVNGITYKWYNVSTGGAALDSGVTYTTLPLTANATYYVEASANGCASTTRTAVNVTVNASPAAVSITPPSASIIQGQTATLTASSATAGVTFNWFTQQTGGTSIFTGATFTTPPLTATTTYYVSATNAAGCNTPARTAVTVTVSNGAVDLSCGGATGQTNTTNGLCVGCTVQNPALAIDSSTQTGSRLNILVGLLGGYAAQRLSFSTTGNPGDSIQVGIGFPAAIADVGLLSSVQVLTYNNGTANGSPIGVNDQLLNLRLLNGGTQAVFTLPVTATYNAVEIRLNSGVASLLGSVFVNYAKVIVAAPQVQQTAPATCPGQTITLNAVTRPNTSFRWYSQPVGGLPLANSDAFTSGVINNDTIFYIEAVSSDGCVSPVRTAVPVTVGLPNVTVASNNVTVNMNQTALLSVSNPVAGYTYQWFAQANGGAALATGPNYTTPPMTVSSTFYVEATNTAGCRTAQRIAVNVNILQVPGAPDAPCGSATSQTNTANGLCIGCYVENPGLAVDSSTTTGSTLHTLVGLTGGYTSQTLIFPTVSNVGDSLRIGLTFPSSLADVSLLNNIQVRTLNGANNNNDLQTINAAPININLLNGNRTAIITYAPLYAFDRVEIRLNSGLASALAALNVNYAARIILPAKAQGDSTAVCTGQPATLTAVARPNTNFRWYATPIGGTALANGDSYTTGPITVDSVFYLEAVSTNGCVAPTRTPVPVKVGLPSVNVTSNNVTVNLGQTATLSVNNPDATFTYQWFTTATGGTAVGTGANFTTPAMTVTSVYYVEATNTTGCKTAARIPVTVTVRQAAGPNDVPCGSATTQTNTTNGLCVGCYVENPTLAVDSSTVTGSTIHVVLGLTNGYASQTLIYPTVSNPGDSVRLSLTFPSSLADLSLLSSIQFGTLNGTTNNNDLQPINAAPVKLQLLANNTQAILTFAPANVWDRVEVRLNSGLLTALSAVNVNYAGRVILPAKAQGDSAAVCTGSPATLVAVARPNTNFRWYATATGGAPLFSGDTYTTGNITSDTVFYLEAISATGCVAPSRTAVPVKVGLPNVTVTSNNVTVNVGQTATLSVNNADASFTYQWFDAPTGGTAVGSGANFTTPPMTVTTVYYVEATSGTGCKTSARIPVTVNVRQVAGPNDVPCGSATSQTNTANGLCIGCYVENPTLAVDSSTTTGSTLHVIAGLLNGYVQQTLIYPSASNVGDSVKIGLTFPSSIANVGALNNIQIATYNGATFNGDRNTLNAAPVQVSLLSNNTQAIISFVPNVVFDRVEIRLNSGVAQLLNAVNINYAGKVVAPARAQGDSAAVCTGTPATLNAVTRPNTTFRWYATAVGGTPLYSGDSFTTGNITADTVFYLEAVSSNGCISPVRTAVPVTVGLPIISVTSNNVTVDRGQTATLTVNNPVAAYTYNWYDVATGGTSLYTGANFTTPPMTVTSVYYVEATNATGCKTAQRIAVTVNVRQTGTGPVVPCGSATTQVNAANGLCVGCYVENPTFAIDSSSTTGSTMHLVLGLAGGNLSQTLIFPTVSNVGDTVKVSFTFPSSLADVGLLSNVQISTLNGTTDNNDLQSINSGPIQLQLLNNNTNAILSYAPASAFDRVRITMNSGIAQALSALNVNYASRVILPAKAQGDSVAVCTGQPATLRAVTRPNTAFRWYTTPTGGTPLATADSYTTGNISSDTTFYLEAISTTGCTSPVRTAVKVKVGLPNVSVTSNNVIVDRGQTALLSVNNPDTSFTYQWFDVATGGTALATGANFTTPPMNVSGVYYVEATNATGCKTAQRIAVNVNVRQTPGTADVPCGSATTQTNAANGLCVGCYVENPNFAVDSSTTTGSTIHLVLGLTGGNVSQTLIFPTVSNIGDSVKVGLTFPSSLADVGLLANIQIGTLNGTTNNADMQTINSGPIQLQLLNNNQQAVLTFAPTKVFDRVQITMNAGLAQALSAVNVNYAARVIAPPVAQADSTAVCTGLPATLRAVTRPNTTFRWYTTATGGTPLFSGDTYTTGNITKDTVFYLEAVSSTGCVSPVRTAVPVTVGLPSISVTSNNVSVLRGQSATLTVNNPVAAYTYNWFDTPTGGTSLFTGPNFTTPAMNITTVYYVEATNATGCKTAQRVPVTVTVIQPNSGADVPCGSATTTTNAANGICVGCYVENPNLAVDSSTITGSTMHLVLGLVNGTLTQTLIYPTPSNVGDSVIVSLTFPSTLADVGLLSNVQIGTMNGTTNNNDLRTINSAPITLQLLAGNQRALVSFKPTAAFDRVVIRMNSGLAQAVSALNVNYAARVIAPAKAQGDSAAVCTGSPATLNAVVTPNTTYRWYNQPVGGAALFVGSQFVTGPITVDSVFYLEAVSASGCAAPTRTPVPVSVGLPNVTVTSNNVTVDRGNTATLSVNNPDATYTYQWFDVATGGTALSTGANFTTPPMQVSSVYYVEATNNIGCKTAQRIAVNVTVRQAPGPNDVPCGSATSQTNAANGLCIGCYVENPGLAIDSSSVTGSTIHVILGLVNGYASQTLIFPTVSNVGDSVQVSLTFPSTIADVGLLSGVQVATYSGTNYNNDIRNINAQGVTLRLLPGNTRAILTYAPAQPFDRIEVRLNSGLAQALSAVNVNYAARIIQPPVPTADSAVICAGTSATLTANQQPNRSYRWYSAPVGGNLLFSGATFVTPALSTTTTYYLEAVAATGCVSPVRVPVRVVVTTAPPAPTVAASTVTTCAGTTATLQATGPMGASFRWYTTATGGTPVGDSATFITPVLDSSKIYYVETYLNSGCVSLTRTAVTVNVSTRPSLPVVTPNAPTICEGNTATLTATSSTPGATINWYTSATAVSPIATGASYTTPVLSTSTTFYVSTSFGQCQSASRVPVLVTVNPAPLAPTVTKIPTNGVVMYGDSATLTAFVTNPGARYYWYTVPTGGVYDFEGATFVTPGLTQNVTYYVEAVSTTGCVSPRTAAALIVDRNFNPGCDIANSDTVITSIGCVLCSVTTPDNAVDNDTTNFAQLNLPVGLLSGSISQYLKFGSTSNAGDSVSLILEVPNTIVNAAVLGSIVVNSANGNTSNNENTRLDNQIVKLDLIGGGTNKFRVTFKPSGAFDRVEIKLDAGLATLFRNLRVYYGFRVVPEATVAVKDVTICKGSTATFTATAPAGVTINWYDAPRGGTLLRTGNTYTTPALDTLTVYYVETVRTSTNCPNPIRVAVTARVLPIPVPPVLVTNDTLVCPGASVVLRVRSSNPKDTIRWFNAPTNGTLLAVDSIFTTPNLSTTTTYYVETFNGTCTNTGGRRAVTVTVNGVVPTPTFTVNNVTICEGAAATFQVTSDSVGVTYRWYTSQAGGTPVFTGRTFTTPALTSSTIYYVEAARGTCVNNGGRVAVTANVNALPTAPVLVNNRVSTCTGKAATLTVANPIAGISYRWYNAPVNGTLLFTGINYIVTPTADSTTYYVEAISAALCASSTRTSATVIVGASPSAPVVDTASVTICSNTSTVLRVRTPQTGHVYRWYSAPQGGTLLFSGAQFVTPILTANTNYYVADSIAGGCPSDTRTLVQVIVRQTPNTPVVAQGTTICAGNNTRLVVQNAQTGVIYRWYDADMGGTLLATDTAFTTPILNATTTYYVESSNGTCTNANGRVAVLVTVNSVPTIPLLVNNNLQTCTSQPVTFTVQTPIPGVTYNWYSAATGGTLLFTGTSYTVTPTGDSARYYVEAVSNNNCASIARASGIVRVTATPAAPTVDSTSVTICKGANATLRVSNPTGSSFYRWYDAPTGGTLLFTGATFITPAVNANTTYYVADSLASGCISATRTAVNVVVRDVPSTPVVASGTNICAGNTARLVVQNRQAGITYRWYNAAGTLLVTDSVYVTPVLSATTSYFVEASNGICSNVGGRVEVVVTVNAVPTTPLVANNNQVSCAGQQVTFNVQNPVTGINYNWYSTATGGTPIFTGANFTVTPTTDSATYYVEALSGSNCPSAARTSVKVVVRTVPNTPIVAGGTNICAGNTARLVVQNRQPGVTYRWYNAAGTLLVTDSVYVTPTLTTTTSYFVEAVNGNCTNAGGQVEVIVTVGTVPTTPVVANNNQATCTGQPVTFNVQNPVMGVTYNWYNSATGGTPIFTGANFTVTPTTDSATYYVEAASGSNCTSIARASVKVTVTPAPPAPTVDVASRTICKGTTTTLNVTNPNSLYIYRWYDAAVGGVLVHTGASFPTPTINVNTTFYVEAALTGGCASATRTSVAITVTDAPAVPILVNSAITTCGGTTASLAIQNPVSGITYNWYDMLTGGTLVHTGATFTTPILTTSTTYYVEGVNAGNCASVSRASAAITVNPAPDTVVVDANNVSTCANTNVMLHVQNPVAGITYRWYDAPTGGTVVGTGADFITPILTATTTYYVEAVSAANCSSIKRTAVTVTIVNGADVPVVEATDITVCRGTRAVIRIRTPRTDLQYSWYDQPVNGNLVFQGPVFQTPNVNAATTYYVEASLLGGSCTSNGRTQVNVTPADAPSTPVLVNNVVTTCSNSTATFAIQNAQPNVTYRWYDAAVNGNLVFTGTSFTTSALTVDINYYVEAVIAGACVSPARAIAEAKVGPRPNAPTVAGNADPICPNTTDTLTATSTQPGVTFNWYTTIGGTTPVFTGDRFITPALTATTTYYVEAAYSNSGCASTARTAVTVTVLSVLPQPTVTSSNQTATSVTFRWNPIVGAIGYRISIDGGQTSIFRPKDSLTYTVMGLEPNQNASIQVMAIGANACANSAWVLSSTKTNNPAGNLVFVPNAFTPNNDGLNDILYVYGTTIQTMQLYIYNQWGQQVFESRDRSVGWDGTMSGKVQPVGVYNYVLKVQLQDGTIINKRGTITIIR
ncbi:gliding motility-associated-like protein [Chitinophaga skermanii]|uniref:Gliding motility-associated-like protein n=1 Tax=Chitinophaga skermanii TaxID=331697 RepID=A0A327QCV9_9BACT|nr:gliding motility-associated C-terminal domain-containing protein [Chitinophaga skermanii]RAJ01678.1 gliding motility-associated-like protein [Chitinophaga skermanii]